jgi:GntR family phosphonate transport system transcriptional regulator
MLGESEDEGITRWARIERQLREDIALGGLGPGSRLPSEHRLAERFGVNRHTVRRALSALQERGLVRVEQGRGTFVEDEPVSFSVGRRTRFTTAAHGDGRLRSQHLVRAYELPAREEAARCLEVKPGAPLICLEVQGLVETRPMLLGYHHFDARRFPEIATAYRDTGSITRALQRFGVADYVRRETQIAAVLPTAEQARLLKQPANRPALRTEWFNVDSDGQPVEYGITLHAGDRSQIVVSNAP